MREQYDNSKSMLRYTMIAVMLTLVVVAVLARVVYIGTVKKAYWEEVKGRLEHDSVKIPQSRGNILGAGGERLACNLPEYRIQMDFRALKESKNDTLWRDSAGHNTPELLELCNGLQRIFPDKPEGYFLKYLNEGFDKNVRYWPVVNRRIDFTTYKKVKALPIFRLKSYKGGFSETKLMIRNRPYGSLASSVVGSTFKEEVIGKDGRKYDQGTPYAGLEVTYDSVLRGKPGYLHRRKVLNSWVSLTDQKPVDGRDVITTIDVRIQDLAERSLIKELKKDNAYTGVAIVMDVKTGDIKAMVNMDLDPNTGEYYEGRNHAIADLLEPGSVFKTASIMVAVDDGYIKDTANTVVDTGCGILDMHGSKMRDHNWHRGGYGRINVPKILQVSSNIGVSWLIDKYYGSDPGKFVDGLYRVGINTDLKLPHPEYNAPRIRHPNKEKAGKNWRYWSKTTLPWMSIGYETQVPPISVLTFYNAIANNGKMVRPRFVTRIEKDGETVQEFPVQVIKNSIAKESTVKIMQDMLEKVVSVGLGKRAGVDGIRVAGKTGTAQKAHNGTYKGGGSVDYLLSFCGYFPCEKPQYSCIVCIQKSGLPASGGMMSGQVFHDIAEGIYAQKIVCIPPEVSDSSYVFLPDVKNGNIHAADFVLNRLGLSVSGGWNGNYADGNPVWGHASKHNKAVQLARTAVMAKDKMPDVSGMGARDAVFLLESRGVKVRLNGRGKVVRQSKEVGKKLVKGERIELQLQ